jgi:hypothetical protein
MAFAPLVANPVCRALLSDDLIHGVVVEVTYRSAASMVRGGFQQGRGIITSHTSRTIEVSVDIKGTIGQLTAERDKLDKAIQALQALEDTPAATARAAAPRATRNRRTRRTAPAATTNGASAGAKALTPAKVVRLVTTDGVPASEIRQQTGGSADAVLRVLKQLESDGTVKRTGARRSTKWHLTGA